MVKRLSVAAALGVLALLAAGCATPPVDGTTNPIVAENKLPGTRDWILSKPKVVNPKRYFGGVRCPWVEGYCSRRSLRPGEQISFHVSTDPASEFTLDIYRMGYYGGDGGRLMKSLGPLVGKTQPTPERDPQRNRLMECNWPAAVTTTVPADWVSGVYLGKLTATLGGEQSYVVFIVRDERNADFLFKCSDNTWGAYNRWPGRWSMYEDDDRQWPGGRESFVSFDRPFGKYYQWAVQPLSTGSGEFLCWEFPLAFWLESRGYNVSYISCDDLHTGAAGLKRARAMISMGHDEYYTMEMVDNLHAAIADGLGAMFLGGNSIGGRVIYEPSNDGRPRRVMSPKLRKRKWPDFPRNREIMGSTTNGVGFAHWDARNVDHWVYAGAGMAEGERIRRLIGWEFHGSAVAKHPGLTILAEAKVVLRSLQDPDDKTKHRGTTHRATVYEGKKGNVVFNAGTIYWTLGLSRPPGVVAPDVAPEVDRRVQRITQNVCDRIVETGRK